MKPFTINDINPKEAAFYDFKNFIGIQKPNEKSKLKQLIEKLKTNKKTKNQKLTKNQNN